MLTGIGNVSAHEFDATVHGIALCILQMCCTFFNMKLVTVCLLCDCAMCQTTHDHWPGVCTKILDRHFITKPSQSVLQ